MADPTAPIEPPAAPAAPIEPVAAAPAEPTPAAAPAAPATPAAIEYAFQAPEGIKLDEGLVTELKAMATTHGWTQEQAQGVADLGVKLQQRMLEAHVTQVDGWATAVQNDPVLGGAKFEASKAAAAHVVALGGDELKSFLNESGLGNHPILFKWAHTISQKLGEAAFVGGAQSPSAPANTEAAMAARLFPTMKR